MRTEHLPKPRMRDLQTELKIDTLDTPINIFLIFEKSFHFPFYCFFFFTFEIVTLKFCLSNYNKHIFIFLIVSKKKKFYSLVDYHHVFPWTYLCYDHIFPKLLS